MQYCNIGFTQDLNPGLLGECPVNDLSIHHQPCLYMDFQALQTVFVLCS